MARFSAEQIYAFARAAGFNPDQAATMTAISLAESGGKSTSHATHGEDSRGLWQINVEANPSYGQRYDLWDPRQNAAAAYEISDHGRNMSMWSTTHGGAGAAYARFRLDAQAAAVAHGDLPGLGVWTGTTGYGDVEPAGHSDGTTAADAVTPSTSGSTTTLASHDESANAGSAAGAVTDVAYTPEPVVLSSPEDHGLSLAAAVPAGIPLPPPPPDTPEEHGLALADPGSSEPASIPDATSTSPADPSTASYDLPTEPPVLSSDATTEHRVDAFVDAALAQRGDAYVFGANVNMDDPHPKAFDCSELVKWSAHRVGIDVPDGSWLQYLDLKQRGLIIPVDQAIHTKGALLFSFSSAPEAGAGRPSHAHVAVSLGDGDTIEARGVAYGVNEFQATTARFQYAAVLPGLAEPTGQSPTSHPSPPVVAADYGVVSSGGRILDTDTANASGRLARRLDLDPHHDDTAKNSVKDSIALLFNGSDPTAGHTSYDAVDAGMHVPAPDPAAPAEGHTADHPPPAQHGLDLSDDHQSPAEHHDDTGLDGHVEPVHSIDLVHSSDSHHAEPALGGEHDGHHG